MFFWKKNNYWHEYGNILRTLTKAKITIYVNLEDNHAKFSFSPVKTNIYSKKNSQPISNIFV